MENLEKLIVDVRESLEKLIVDVKESLERELAGIRQDVQQVQQSIVQLNGRFDTQAARLERHAGLWQTGARWSNRMDTWAEKVDASLEAKDREIGELRERLQRLERPSA
jgi:chromosome segregation ATPase